MHTLEQINKKYPIRRTHAQKESFRRHIVTVLEKRGIAARVEKTENGKNYNVVIGDPTTAKAVFTAHYDTPAASPFPNLMIPRNKFFFFAYQFLPVVLLLAVSLGIAYAVSYAMGGDQAALFIAFMVAYYGLYFLLFRTVSNKNNFNDNTSGVAAVLEIICRLNSKQLTDVAFILFDNEEKGKLGSKAYFNDHREDMKDRFVVNFDCVGNGDNIIFIYMKGAEDTEELARLEAAFEGNGEYNVSFYSIKGSESNSDYKNFPRGVGCMACKKSKCGLLYTPNIHTNRDTEAKSENIDFIADRTVRFIGEFPGLHPDFTMRQGAVSSPSHNQKGLLS